MLAQRSLPLLSETLEPRTLSEKVISSLFTDHYGSIIPLFGTSQPGNTVPASDAHTTIVVYSRRFLSLTILYVRVGLTVPLISGTLNPLHSTMFLGIFLKTSKRLFGLSSNGFLNFGCSLKVWQNTRSLIFSLMELNFRANSKFLDADGLSVATYETALKKWVTRYPNERASSSKRTRRKSCGLCLAIRRFLRKKPRKSTIQ